MRIFLSVAHGCWEMTPADLCRMPPGYPEENPAAHDTTPTANTKRALMEQLGDKTTICPPLQKILTVVQEHAHTAERLSK